MVAGFWPVSSCNTWVCNQFLKENLAELASTSDIVTEFKGMNILSAEYLVSEALLCAVDADFSLIFLLLAPVTGFVSGSVRAVPAFELCTLDESRFILTIFFSISAVDMMERFPVIWDEIKFQLPSLCLVVHTPSSEWLIAEPSLYLILLTNTFYRRALNKLITSNRYKAISKIFTVSLSTSYVCQIKQMDQSVLSSYHKSASSWKLLDVVRCNLAVCMMACVRKLAISPTCSWLDQRLIHITMDIIFVAACNVKWNIVWLDTRKNIVGLYLYVHIHVYIYFYVFVCIFWKCHGKIISLACRTL